MIVIEIQTTTATYKAAQLLCDALYAGDGRITPVVTFVADGQQKVIPADAVVAVRLIRGE